MTLFTCNLERTCTPPCENNGVCGADPRDPDQLICFCPSGFFGESCEDSKSYWSESNLDSNCINTINDNIEIWHLFFHGWSIDVCDSDPCYNGGTCHYESGMAKCECLPGYDGRFCELSKLKPPISK